MTPQSAAAYRWNSDLQAHSNSKIYQTLRILLTKPIFLPWIHTKDHFQRCRMEGEHPRREGECPDRRNPDRKSTRLNSSHQIISYAVFCLKKKKKNQQLHKPSTI